MFGLRFGAITAGKIGYVATCLVASVMLVASGYAHNVVSLVDATGTGANISNSPSVGAMNILVMGLESRTNYQGQELDHHLQYVMHVGSDGSQDTNTLILIHIFAGGQKAVGFSISRDDLVNYPEAYYQGIAKGKIDAAYHWAYLASLAKTAGSGMSLAQQNLKANQAGQVATVRTVESVTGVTIDHFIEVNLFGFYYMADAFHGMEVCIKPYPGNNGLNLTDYNPFAHPPTDNSGFDAIKDGYNKAKGGPQYLHLDAAQSLAFVRSRDTLPGTDLGRTYRQQATIDYAIWRLKHDGTLGDFGTLRNLLGNLKNVLITDQQFKLLDFATNMGALTGKNMSLTTLPYTPENGVPLAGYPSPQDVNVIDVPYLQRMVKDAFYPQPGTARTGGTKKPGGKKTAATPAPSTITVDVYNGDPNAPGLAGKVSADLVALGYQAGAVQNSSAQSQPVEAGTQVFYGAGAAANATAIATQFGTTAKPLTSLKAHHVEVLIGSTVTIVPAGLTPSSTASAATQSVGAQLVGAHGTASSHQAPAPSATSAGGSAGLNGPATVAPNAPYGIPCVY